MAIRVKEEIRKAMSASKKPRLKVVRSPRILNPDDDGETMVREVAPLEADPVEIVQDVVAPDVVPMWTPEDVVEGVEASPADAPAGEEAVALPKRGRPKRRVAQVSDASPLESPLPEGAGERKSLGSKKESHLFEDLGIGSRLKALRESMNLTQFEAAIPLDVSRGAVWQWENSVTLPTIPKLLQLARFYQTTPEYIAFGIGDMNLAAQTTVTVPEIVFGETPRDRTTVEGWKMPLSYLRNEMKVTEPAALIAYQIDSDAFSPKFHIGDRVIVDTKAKSPMSAYYLLWDGTAAVLAQIELSIRNPQDATVYLSADQSVERAIRCKTQDLTLIGRVRGKLSHNVRA